MAWTASSRKFGRYIKTERNKARSPKHQGLTQEKRYIRNFVYNEKFIITLSETHIASVNSKLFRIPGVKFIHKNRISGEGGGVAKYLSDDLK